MPKFLKTGFTLIELLIVIAILGILATFFIGNFGGAGAKARDSERKSDLKQYQSSLASYAGSKKGFYPSRTGAGVVIGTLCSDLNSVFDPDIVCPNDPKYDPSSGTPTYNYSSNGGNLGASDATSYVLWGILESAPLTGFKWVVCSNGQTGEVCAAQNISDGVCPIGLTCPI